MLHPELVHFPIAFTFLALLFSFIALFVRSKGFNIAFLILSLAMALGATLAAMAGQDAAVAARAQLGSGIESYIDSHKEWASFTVVMTWISALLCLIQFLTTFAQGRKAYTVFSILTFLALILTSFAVYETAKRGGALVYEHGAGVQDSYTPPAEHNMPQRRSYSRNAQPQSSDSNPSQSSPSSRSSGSSTQSEESPPAQSSPSNRSSSPSSRSTY